MNAMFDLTGKVALVTGAYRGLGYAIAEGLASAGARVVLNGRRADVLDAAVASLVAKGHKASASVFDVTDGAAIRSAVSSIERDIGAIDILFNNAGIQRRGAMVDFPAEQWAEVIATT